MTVGLVVQWPLVANSFFVLLVTHRLKKADRIVGVLLGNCRPIFRWKFGWKFVEIRIIIFKLEDFLDDLGVTMRHREYKYCIVMGDFNIN